MFARITNMCAPVRFYYSCGCTEDVKFECAGAHRERHVEHPPMTTWLNEYCHNCDMLLSKLVMALSGAHRESTGNDSSGSECRALRERDINLPSKLPPTALSSES